MAISIETVRVGYRYYLRNYGEYHEFEVQKAVGHKDFICKDLQSLEKFRLSELTEYGTGSDYEFFELEEDA